MAVIASNGLASLRHAECFLPMGIARWQGPPILGRLNQAFEAFWRRICHA
jgi:hypothetical protein